MRKRTRDKPLLNTNDHLAICLKKKMIIYKKVKFPKRHTVGSCLFRLAKTQKVSI